MKLDTLVMGLVMSCATSIVSAAGVSWVDWSKGSTWSDPYTGTLTTNSSSIGATLTGSYPLDLFDGDTWYNNDTTGGTSPVGTYAGMMPSDVIQVSNASSFTITFTEAILNPYIALVSVGRTYEPVTYHFSAPVTVISSGPNSWGYGGYTLTGNDFTGREYNGILQLAGLFTSISFRTDPSEYWHGFNVGTSSVSPVPLPAAFPLFLSGLALLGIATRRMKKNAS